MKKNKMLLLIITATLSLAACGPSIDPNSKYGKVSKAFNAVEQSFEKVANSKRLVKPNNYMMDIDGAMGDISSYYSNVGESDETLASQIDVDTPPLAQFKYLKIIYEEIGSSYEFDTKYYYDITGSIYLDIETGIKDEAKSANNKLDYVFSLSISVNIDDNDFITSFVGMDITLKDVNNKEYKSTRFVKMDLDYDFSKNDNNYEMSLFDTTHESDLTYLDIDYSYEYDYVKVNGGTINEWRKFHYESSVPMVKDSSHQTLDDYRNEGAIIKADNCRWYKNNTMKRLDSGSTGANSVADALFNKMGLNDTDLEADAYYAKTGNKSNVIKNVYDNITRTSGNELIYIIVARDESDVKNNWPSDIINRITYRDDIFFSNSNKITYTYSYEESTENPSVIINVRGATSADYDTFENYLVNSIGFNDSGTQEGFETYFLQQYDAIIYIAVSRTLNILSISVTYGNNNQNYYLELDGAIDIDFAYDSYLFTSYAFEKELYDDLYPFTDLDLPRLFEDKIDMSSTYKVEINFPQLEVDLNKYQNMYEGQGWSLVPGANNMYYIDRNGAEEVVALDFKNVESNSQLTIIRVHLTSTVITNYINNPNGEDDPNNQDNPGTSEEEFACVTFYMVDEHGVNPLYSDSYQRGEVVNLSDLSFEGNYLFYYDEACKENFVDFFVIEDDMNIYVKEDKQEEDLKGTITIYDPSNKNVLTAHTDVIGSEVKGGALFSYVLYYDPTCTQMVLLDETVTISNEPLALYCRDYSNEDYVNLEIKTYINNILYDTNTQIAVRKGKIMTNNQSSSFPVYYDFASCYDTEYTLKLDASSLTPYSNEYIALTSDSILSIYCEGDYPVYTMYGGDDKLFEFIYIGSPLTENSVVLHKGQYYIVDSVNGTKVSCKGNEAASYFTVKYVYNGRVVAKQDNDFKYGDSYTYIGTPGSIIGYSDINCTDPIYLPENGEIAFTSSATIYVPYRNI